MKQIDKKKLDEAIRLNKKYFRSSDADLLTAVSRAEDDAFGKDRHWMSSIMNGITCKRYDKDEPYETYYRVMEALGYEIC